MGVTFLVERTCDSFFPLDIEGKWPTIKFLGASTQKKNKLHGPSPQANYTDLAFWWN
jgi:hypothetical protein